MRPTLALSALCAALLPALPAAAFDANQRFAMKGAALQPCGAFLRSWSAGNADLALYGGWVDGYLTGLNQFREGFFDIAPWQTTQTMLGLVRAACEQSSPETRFMDAFYRVVPALLPQAQALEGQPVTIERDGQRIVLYDGTVRAAKAALAAAGHDPGPADDAAFTDQTATAIRAYQEQEGIPATGLFDQQTLFRLLLVTGDAAAGAAPTAGSPAGDAPAGTAPAEAPASGTPAPAEAPASGTPAPAEAPASGTPAPSSGTPAPAEAPAPAAPGN